MEADESVSPVENSQQVQEVRMVQNKEPADPPKETNEGLQTPRAGTEVALPNTTKVVRSSYGRPTLVSSFGSFPGPGSLLGPFFSLGRLGKGTFCSIHKCLNLSSVKEQEPRLVAAKVELTDFANSGVLEGEATMLQHLHSELPPHTVPHYVGHFKSDEAAAIVMEYLPGNDMHHLRGNSRRVSMKDAVYLAADVMLPLLQHMHEAGVVHRDVKPSNCVRYQGNQFCMVDFGLSKSVICPAESESADPAQVWKNDKTDTQYCLRKERAKADFRGTSMYASLRVHQGRDYARRDDMWSLLYVFCDLVSGGLPWMSYAAAKDRESCERLKEQIHGDSGGPHKTEEMLKGEEYHLSKYRRDVASRKGQAEADLPPLAPPLEMSKDPKKVELLREAFAHVATLKFADKPDYAILQECLHGFLEDLPEPHDPDYMKPIEWEEVDPAKISNDFSPQNTKKRKRCHAWKEGVPTWGFASQTSAPETDEALWEEAEEEKAEDAKDVRRPLHGDAADLARLPLEWQFRVMQMEYNAKHTSLVTVDVALKDWMQCALPLLYGRWDAEAYEPGRHRTQSDTYRRDVYLKLVEKCLKCAARFQYFRNKASFYEKSPDGTEKRRKIISSNAAPGHEGVEVSKVLLGLHAAKLAESKKSTAPPPALSFGSGMGS